MRRLCAEGGTTRNAGHSRPAALPLLRGQSVRWRKVPRAHEPLGTQGQRRRTVRSSRLGVVALAIQRTGAAGLPESLGMFAGATSSTPALQAVLDALGNQNVAVGYSLLRTASASPGPILCM